MSELPGNDFLLMNALWLRKMADQPTLEANAGLSKADTELSLGSVVGAGYVRDLAGHFVLTDDGRQAVLAHYERSYGELQHDPAVVAWYERFETYNSRFLKLVSAWQTESDDSRERVYTRLLRIVERHIDALADGTMRIARYEHYARRFQLSLDRIDAGQTEYVTGPMLDSLHNIWFEFHEDILAVLGRPRESVED